MELYGARVFVQDMVAARKFHAETLGLPITFETDGTIGFDMGVNVMVEVDDGDHDNPSGRFTGLSIAAADVQAKYEQLRERGVSFLEPPKQQPWDGTLTHFTDPSENIWTLVSD